MKKIGIITYHRSHNFGAVLQAYALRHYIKEKNIDVEIVDYWPNYRKGMYDLFNVDLKNKSIYMNIKGSLKRTLSIYRTYIRYNRFNKFISNELNVELKAPLINGNQIMPEYDILFFGSDQIWRYNEFPSFTGFDPVYWGEFPKNSAVKKIAYAASMGVMNSDFLDSDKIKKLLINFNSIAVREKQLLDYIQPLTNIKIEHVLDPVFLLNIDQWTLLAEKGQSKNNFTKKYLLLYNLNSSKEAYKLAGKIAKEKNLEIYELSGRPKPFKFDKNVKDKYGPIEYLNAFLNADFVIASSFHGVAFSILFQKNFLSLGMKNNADRVVSLLNSLGLNKHYVESSEGTSSMEINYIRVNENLDILKKKSKRYIENNL
jgi:hypothetical protein